MMRPFSLAVINTIRVRPLVIEQREERRAVEPPILELEPARQQGSLTDGAEQNELSSAAVKDVRYAFRTLRRSPWYCAMVVCVLGVSMGLATIVFAVVDGVLFKPLSYHRPPQELYLVRTGLSPGS